MARPENPPFALGETGNGIGAATVDATVFDHLVGMEWVFGDAEDPDALNTQTGAERSRIYNTFRLVENAAGFAVEPKRLVQLDAKGETILGYTDDVDNLRVAVVDEHLPSAGCPANDKCWVQVAGIVTMLVSLNPTEANGLSANSRVVAATAVTSGATTAGRIRAFSAAATGVTASEEIFGALGTNISAATTADTGADLHVLMRRHF